MMVNLLARMLGLDNPAEPKKEKKGERDENAEKTSTQT